MVVYKAYCNRQRKPSLYYMERPPNRRPPGHPWTMAQTIHSWNCQMERVCIGHYTSHSPAEKWNSWATCLPWLTQGTLSRQCGLFSWVQLKGRFGTNSRNAMSELKYQQTQGNPHASDYLDTVHWYCVFQAEMTLFVSGRQAGDHEDSGWDGDPRDLQVSK